MTNASKVLLGVAGQAPRVAAAEVRQLAEAGGALRNHVFPEALSARVVNYCDVLESSAWWRPLYQFMPKGWAIAFELFRQRKSADVVVSWSEQISLGYTLLKWIFADKTPHVAMMYWMSKPLVRKVLRVCGSAVDRIVTWTSVQRNFALREFAFSDDKVVLVRHFVDEKFWKLQTEAPVEDGLIAAVGLEMRDYDTFIEAMKGSSLKGFIATREIKITKAGLKARIYKPEEVAPELPANVAIGPLGLHELKNLYARAALVVVPILPSDTDNGVTVILEAMAMGKVVICSRTKGQVDVIEHGVNGFYVEPQNPSALRKMMEELASNEELRAEIGAKARKHIETYHRLEIFSRDVAKAVREVVLRDN